MGGVWLSANENKTYLGTKTLQQRGNNAKLDKAVRAKLEPPTLFITLEIDYTGISSYYEGL